MLEIYENNLKPTLNMLDLPILSLKIIYYLM